MEHKWKAWLPAAFYNQEETGTYKQGPRCIKDCVKEVESNIDAFIINK